MAHIIYAYIAFEPINYEQEPVALFIAKKKIIKWAKDNDKPNTTYIRMREGGEDSYLTDITEEIKKLKEKEEYHES